MKAKNLQEAILEINPNFNGMEHYFKQEDEDSFAAFCHSQMSGGIGMKIRNIYEFWHNETSPLYLDLKNNHHCNHPDAMSDKIIRGIYKLRTNIMQQIKAIRQHLDHLMIETKNYPSNREVSLAYTNTQRASMWLGQVLKELEEPNPYPNSTDTSNTKIEPRADQAHESPAIFNAAPTGNNTITVKWFREQLQAITDKLVFSEQYTNASANHARSIVIDALKEAKMWWGWELNNIFNAEKATSPQQ